jgi:hypothetical protein
MDNKELRLIIKPQIIRLLGIQMYQKPADVISELIANAWDADAEQVNIDISDGEIEVKDDGNGMTFDQCQNYYLNVGRDRRRDTRTKGELSERFRRPVLGRKGIGKFAGFGIAKSIEVETISIENGERTSFSMDLDKILEVDKTGNEQKIIDVIQYAKPSTKNKDQHKTLIRLLLKDGINKIEVSQLTEDISRRFLLTQQYGEFSISVAGGKVFYDFEKDLEYFFPRDLNDDEIKKFPALKKTLDGWAEEIIEGGTVFWRLGYFKEPIKKEELRGLSVFARGKIAQKPFFFDLTGGISAQESLEYLTGQVEFDLIDTGDNDLISTERQRINLQSGIGVTIRDWGQELIKQAGSIWKTRRAEARIKELDNKVGKFKDRLDKLPASERKTVKSVLIKIANFERLDQKRFEEWCGDILTSWETGRLRGLIEDISNSESIDTTRMLEILQEAQVLTSLNVAESIKTKIYSIAELKKRVDAKDLENSIRDYIYLNPWLIHPKWESYKKEKSVSHIITNLGEKHLDTDGIFSGRVDLALSSGDDLLLIEFMRPGLNLDRDHIDRLNNYVSDIRVMIAHETGLTLSHLSSAYIVADSHDNDIFIAEKIKKLKEDNIFLLTWDTLISQAIKQWQEQLDILKLNNRADPRIQAL